MVWNKNHPGPSARLVNVLALHVARNMGLSEKITPLLRKRSKRLLLSSYRPGMARDEETWLTTTIALLARKRDRQWDPFNNPAKAA